MPPRHLRRKKQVEPPADRQPRSEEAPSQEVPVSLFGSVDDGSDVASEDLDGLIADALAGRPAAPGRAERSEAPEPPSHVGRPEPPAPFTAIAIPPGVAQLETVCNLGDVIHIWRVFDEMAPAPEEPAASAWNPPPPPLLPPPPSDYPPPPPPPH